MSAPTPLLAALRDPGSLIAAQPRQWEEILALSRRHGLSGRWQGQMAALGALGHLDRDVADQLSAEARVADRRRHTLAWETTCVARALGTLEIPVVLLKGAAYLALDLPPARARMSADLDILVPYAALAEVEKACLENGWRSMAGDPYDEAYFRRWMHELPPMQHVSRGTVIDVHHNILPRTSRLCPDAARLLAGAVSEPVSGLAVLQPADMLLHSIVHGFYDGEFTNALRDVLDVHELTSHFIAIDSGFWDDFARRTLELGFAGPALLALTAARRFFGLSIPAETESELAVAARAMPLKGLFEWSLRQVVMAPPRSSRRQRFASGLLRARSHLQKMPPLTLVRHLSYKTWLRLTRSQTDG